MPNHYGDGGEIGGGGPGGYAQGPAIGDRLISPAGNTDGINLSLGGVLETGAPITTQTKVTKGYFTGDSGLLTSNLIHTGSLGSSNLPYYFNVTNTHTLSSSVATQFSVAYGHRGGSGSVCLDSDGELNLEGATRAVYQQFASLVLPEQEISGGFMISEAGSWGGALSDNTPEEFVYILVGNRARFKDEMDYGNWTLKLKGQTSAGVTGPTLLLTDDSKDTTLTTKNSIFGRKFNIVSGSAGTIYNAATSQSFGFFYPEAGFMVFSGHELSASIPGQAAAINMTASFDTNLSANSFLTSSGLAPNLFNNGNPQNALKFVNCMRLANTEEQRFRSAQYQNKKSYFLTVPPGSCNFTTNPTFTSGSDGKLRHKSMYGNPSVFISTVGLHRADGRLVAVAKLSTPIIKNFGTQATVKVNLTY